MKLFHANKLDVFHNNQCSHPSTVVSLPTYIEIKFHGGRVSQVTQNPIRFICFAMKKYHSNSLHAYYQEKAQLRIKNDDVNVQKTSNCQYHNELSTHVLNRFWSDQLGNGVFLVHSAGTLFSQFHQKLTQKRNTVKGF